MQRYIIRITGTVQGVVFRETARQMAARLGLAGFVRNEPDGSVYIEAEGDEERLKRFLGWCHEGPPRAVVRDVTYNIETVMGYSGFDIR